MEKTHKRPLGTQDDQEGLDTRPSVKPCTQQTIDSATSLRNQPEQLKACQETLDRFVAKEIMEEVAEIDTEGLYAAFFGVAKKDMANLQGC